MKILRLNKPTLVVLLFAGIIIINAQVADKHSNRETSYTSVVEEPLEDVVEFFNLIDQTKLTSDEKKDLVAFLRQL